MHNGFVNVNNEKMSKSKGNFLTLRSALGTDLDLRAFRYLVVCSQYRTPLNFNAEALQGAVTAVAAIASTHNLLVDGALMPALVESWGRLARHVTGEPLTDLAITEGRLTCAESGDPLRSLDPDKGWALVETLRLSVLGATEGSA